MGRATSIHTFFNCSKLLHDRPSSLLPQPCLGHGFYSYYSELTLDAVELVSYKKMYDLPVTGPFDFDPHLSWSKPRCSKCYKVKRECCVLKQGRVKLEVECSGDANRSKGLVRGKRNIGQRLRSSWMITRLSSLHASLILTLCESRTSSMLNWAEELMEQCSKASYPAVKVLDNNNSVVKGNGEDFVNEVGAMAGIHHVNVVRLVGFCADGFKRVLVYEYLPNDSLQKYISYTENQHSRLGWKKLQEIAIGIAKGIEYLHQGCHQRILHFDIKPCNILLDQDFILKISDFSLYGAMSPPIPRHLCQSSVPTGQKWANCV